MTADKFRRMVARDIAVNEGESESWILNELEEVGAFNTWTEEDFKSRPVDYNEICEWLFVR